jgi:hypothetical protein
MVVVVGVSFVAGLCSTVDWGTPREHGESAAQGILVSRGTARRDNAISEHENGMVCLRGAVLASVRDCEAINANMPPHGQFDIRATFALLFGFVAFMGIWTILLLRHCNHIPEPAFPGKQKES